MQLPLLSTPMRYFLEVARTGSVNQAASRLFVSPSSVSRQVVRLEESLGTQLFERQPTGMELTSAGVRLAGHLNTALLDAQFVIDQVQDLGLRSAGRVRVCCAEGLASGFMLNVLRACRDSGDIGAIELSVIDPDEMGPHVLRGDADLAVKFVTGPEPGLRVELSSPAQVLAVMRPDHPLARRRVISLDEAVKYPLLVGSQSGTARQLFDMACAAKGLQYQPVFVSNFASVVLPMLRTPELHLASLFTVAHLIDSKQVVARPFSDAILAQRKLNVLSLEGRSLPEPLSRFVSTLGASMASVARRKLGRAS